MAPYFQIYLEISVTNHVQGSDMIQFAAAKAGFCAYRMINRARLSSRLPNVDIPVRDSVHSLIQN